MQKATSSAAVMLAGDRDAWLDEPRSAELAERFGISVGHSWADPPVTIVHGHELDPLCGAWGDAADRPPTLRESLSVDLVARFAFLMHETETAALARRVMGTLVASCPLDVPRRLRAWLDRADAVGALSHDSRNRIESAWARAVDGWQRRAIAETPLGRWGTPEDIARAVRFLAGPRAEWITGQILRVNGGAVRG